MSYFSHSWCDPSSELAGRCRPSARSPPHTGKNSEFPPPWSSSFSEFFPPHSGEGRYRKKAGIVIISPKKNCKKIDDKCSLWSFWKKTLLRFAICFFIMHTQTNAYTRACDWRLTGSEIAHNPPYWAWLRSRCSFSQLCLHVSFWLPQVSKWTCEWNWREPFIFCSFNMVWAQMLKYGSPGTNQINTNQIKQSYSTVMHSCAYTNIINIVLQIRTRVCPSLFNSAKKRKCKITKRIGTYLCIGAPAACIKVIKI